MGLGLAKPKSIGVNGALLSLRLSKDVGLALRVCRERPDDRFSEGEMRWSMKHLSFGKSQVISKASHYSVCQRMSRVLSSNSKYVNNEKKKSARNHFPSRKW